MPPIIAPRRITFTSSRPLNDIDLTAVWRRIIHLVTHTLQSDTSASAAVAHHILHFPATLLRIHTAVLSAVLAKAHTADYIHNRASAAPRLTSTQCRREDGHLDDDVAGIGYIIC
jgi:hypothetical protein